jgi:hypothetical protein
MKRGRVRRRIGRITWDNKCKYYVCTYGRAQSINKCVTECVPRPENPQVREGKSEEGEAGGDVVCLDVRTHVCCCLYMQGVKGGPKDVRVSN